MPDLVHIPFSPWSFRARTSLDAQGVSYRKVVYTTMLSEPWLRFKLGQWSGKVSVPVLLLDDGGHVRNGIDIAAWGSKTASHPLITDVNRADCEAVEQLADTLLEAGRIRTTRRVLADEAALFESLPTVVKKLGPLALVIGRKAAGDLLRKYPTADDADDACLTRMTDALDGIAARLGDRPYVLGDQLSYADITAAAALSFVSPHTSAPLGPRSVPCWTEPTLVARHPHLLTWRDRIVAELKERAKR